MSDLPKYQGDAESGATPQFVTHDGRTGVRQTPTEIEDGIYRFWFHAGVPRERRWIYRLLAPDDENGLTNERLEQLLLNCPYRPYARWEEQLGFALGRITLFFRPETGQNPVRVRAKRGKEMPLELPQKESRPEKIVRLPRPIRDEDIPF